MNVLRVFERGILRQMIAPHKKKPGEQNKQGDTG
jgi:hypothetical protein